MTLAGRTALITGANRGLGKAIATAFAGEGARLLLVAREEQLLTRTCEELSRSGAPEIHSVKADVSRRDDVLRLVRTCQTLFPRLDILVNNAGIYGPLGPLEETPWEEWVRTIEINLLGTVALCHALVPQMKKQGYGKIINLSGGGATSPLPRMSAYAASKAAVIRLTETLAGELRGTGIDVNAIAPGALNTRLLDEILQAGPDRVGQEFYQRSLRQKEEGGIPLEKGAALAVFLASAESDGITGKLISAVWDDWKTFPRRRDILTSSDVYTLRRIVPKDRGLDW